MNYNWIKVGAKVRIKTVEEIQEMYPNNSMPYSLNSTMESLCGTIQIIERYYQQDYADYGCKLCVTIGGWSWPETVLLPTLSKLGNTI